jgi:hypothetical protein
MGIDIEIVAYRGRALSDATIRELVSQFAQETEWFRHSIASAVRKPLLDDLHCLAFYDDVRGEPVDKAADPSPSSKLYFSETKLREIREAGERGGSLASLVQAAWKATREEMRKLPAKPAHEPAPAADVAIARALSKLRGEAFLVGYADHSCVGIYGQFRKGELVVPATEREVHSDRDYLAAPSRAWSAALGRKITIDGVVRAYFPETAQPPLHAVGEARTIPYDGNRFMMTLVE